MYRKILIGYDQSDRSKDALALGRQLAEATGAGLVLAGVFEVEPKWSGFDPDFRNAETEFAGEIEAAARSVGGEGRTISSGSAARGLHRLAEELDADLILVGSAHHGRIGQVVAGSVGVALLEGSPCAVGIAPDRYREQADNGLAAIVVGIDGSVESQRALRAAGELAAGAGAKLKLIAVAEAPVPVAGRGAGGGWHALMEAVEEGMREQLGEARRTVPEGVEVEATLISGHPAEALAGAAGAPGSLLVVGSRGYGPLRRVLLGSVSRKLVRSAPCPLIVAPRGAHETGEAEPRAEVDAAR